MEGYPDREGAFRTNVVGEATGANAVALHP
jgi:hypothetical protein